MGNASTRRITVANEGGTPSVIKVSDSVIGRLKEANEAPQQRRLQEKPAEVSEPMQAAPQIEAPPVPVAPVVEPLSVVEPSPVVEPLSVVEPPPVVELLPVVEPPQVPIITEVPEAPPVIEVPPPEPPVVIVAAIEEPAPTVIPEPVSAPQEQPPAVAQQQQAPNYFFPEEAHLALLRLRQERELELKKVEDYWRERLKTVESKYVNLNKLTSEEFAKSVAEVEQLYKKETCGPICQGAESSVIKCYKENPKQSLVCSPIVKEFSQCVASASLNALSTAG